MAAEAVCVRTVGRLSSKSSSKIFQNERVLPLSIRACQASNDKTKFYNELGFYYSIFFTLLLYPPIIRFSLGIWTN